MKKLLLTFTSAIALLLIVACGSANCPIDNYVVCNYWFYNTSGSAISFNDEITVTTLKPGTRNLYIYRKLGERTLQYDRPVPALVDSGYTESINVVRKDTVLVNKLRNGSKFALPMSYYNPEDTIIISYSSISSSDTILVTHDSYTHVEQPECGSYRFHTLTNIRATDRGIDHVEITNPKVNYEGAENIRIYFNTFE